VSLLRGSAARWLGYRLGLRAPDTQLTLAERDCLRRHAGGRHRLVEIGVMHGATTALLRAAMHPDGVVTGIDPHPNGRLGVSFERWIARREVARHLRGRAVLLRQWSYQASTTWRSPIDFLFVDGDHSREGLARDWTDWSPFVVPGGVAALHDSRTVPWRPDLDSVAYTQEVILRDPRFRLLEEVDSLTMLERVREATDP